MRAFFVFLLFIAFALAARWYYVCKIKNMCAEPIEVVIEKEARDKSLVLKDGDKVILKDYEQFRFDKGSIAPILTENNQDFLDKIATHIKANPEKNMTIKGYYRASESNMTSGMFENLGVARANKIRAELLERGIDEKRITLDFAAIDGEDLKEPISFSLYKPELDVPDEFEKVAFTFKNMTFSDANFEYNSAEFRPGEQFLLYADSLKNYFDSYPDKELVIIGHTDSIGSQGYNKNLGLKRAESAKEYFEEMGISVKMSVDSDGKLKPMASNNSEEGRQKNRRVNFVIKDKEE